jgi:hypothetical protein
MKTYARTLIKKIFHMYTYKRTWHLEEALKSFHCDWASFSFFRLTCGSDCDSHGGDDGGVISGGNGRSVTHEFDTTRNIATVS